MILRGTLPVGLVALVALVLGGVAAAQSNPVTYDSFMQMDQQGRIRTFNEITPENRAELVRTQIERWLAAHRASLTPEQIAMMEENLAFVVPDIDRRPKDPQMVARSKELEARTVTLFTREQIMDALTIQGPFIPAR